MSFDKAFYLFDHRLIALAMVVLLVAAGEIGFRRGLFKRKSKESFRSLMSGTGGAMLGLLGLLLGFTLAMAVSRWDERRDVIVEEANAISTLRLRAGLLEAPLRNELRDALREYTDTRIALSGSRGDPAALHAARSESELLHASIWSVVERADQPGRNPAVYTSLITAANVLIDLHELRLASIENRLPAPLFLMLFTVASVSLGFLAWAFGAANQGGRVAFVALGLLIGSVLLLIMDVNRPQRGRIAIGLESLERVDESMDATPPADAHSAIELDEENEQRNAQILYSLPRTSCLRIPWCQPTVHNSKSGDFNGRRSYRYGPPPPRLRRAPSYAHPA